MMAAMAPPAAMHAIAISALVIVATAVLSVILLLRTAGDE
jgi:hypothetical protein